ncbi:hypothetical protein CF8_0203 [Aeromonas phage CF8]|nr:hypothetical protein CF8_0203 [Aeromonas phage CF8]
MENVSLQDQASELIINKTVEDLVKKANAMQQELNGEQPSAEDDQLLISKPNFIGAVIGVGAAVALEAFSPTGSKASAIAAAAAGGALIGVARKALDTPFQNKFTGTVCGLVAFKCAKVVGRNVAEYFPNVKEVEAIDTML